LLFLINQQADFTNKLGAMREYNKLKQRIIEKKDITSGCLPIPLFGNVSTHNGASETPKLEQKN